MMMKMMLFSYNKRVAAAAASAARFCRTQSICRTVGYSSSRFLMDGGGYCRDHKRQEQQQQRIKKRPFYSLSSCCAEGFARRGGSGELLSFRGGSGSGSSRRLLGTVAKTTCTTRRSRSTLTTTSTTPPEDDTAKNSTRNRRVVRRKPITPYPILLPKPPTPIPSHIVKPQYADTGIVIPSMEGDNIIVIHDETSIRKMRRAAQLARNALDYACQTATIGMTTEELDLKVHNYILDNNAYPSPLNYGGGFPKSTCTSVNEVVCHGIPDSRALEFGDVLSIDVSVFTNDKVHGDNCATIIIGDNEQQPNMDDEETRTHFELAHKLKSATKEALDTAISTIHPGSCLTEIGSACQSVAEQHGFSSVIKYRGHGISQDFHIAPFVKHCKNNDKLELVPGMIFTIEPMLISSAKNADVYEWEYDGWTVSTKDITSLSAQFEHTILVTEENGGVEILTLPNKNWE